MQMQRDTSTLVAEHILQRLGEGGLPPEIGVSLINVGNDGYLEVLEEEYFQRQLKVGSSFKLVQGYYGGGKTHFLACVRELAWRHGFLTSVVELSPSECPYDDSMKVYRAVVRRAALPPAETLGQHTYGLADTLRDLVAAHVDAQGERETRRWLQRIVARTPCESRSFRSAVVAYCVAVLDDNEGEETALGAWLCGEPVPAADVRPAGVYEAIDKSNSFTMLRSLTQMAVGLGLPGTVLLFDEVDRTLSVSAKRAQVIGDNLRQVVDLCGRQQLPNTLFVYAVPPEFMRNVVPDYPALYQRLKSPIPLSVRSPQAVLIDLEKLDLEPQALLAKIGLRLVEVFETARSAGLDPELQATNAARLAGVCASAFFEVNHRRLFVKTWVDLLHQQAVDGQSELTRSQLEKAVQLSSESLLDKGGDDDFADF